MHILLAEVGGCLLAGVVFAPVAVQAARVDTIAYGSGWQANTILPEGDLTGATDIESYDSWQEFVVVGPFGMRDYYSSGGNLVYAQMVNTPDYKRVADGGGAGSFFALGTDNRVDRVHAVVNDYVTDPVLPAGVLTGSVSVESYDSFNEFVSASNEGVRDYYQSGGNWVFESLSTVPDYIGIADSGAATGTFFAMGSDGRVDKIAYGGSGYATTNVLPAGTLANAKYIESYDGNNEFVTISDEGVREYYFSGGAWQFDPMSSSNEYFAIADNGGASASYFALASVPEPASTAFAVVGFAFCRRHRQAKSR